MLETCPSVSPLAALAIRLLTPQTFFSPPCAFNPFILSVTFATVRPANIIQVSFNTIKTSCTKPKNENSSPKGLFQPKILHKFK